MSKQNSEDFDQIAYQNQYNKEKYDRFSLIMPKGKKDEIKKIAKERGMSLNEFINMAIDEATKNNNY